MAGGMMSQVTGLIPGMKREEEVPDVAPQEGEYQEYTVRNKPNLLSLNNPPSFIVKLTAIYSERNVPKKLSLFQEDGQYAEQYQGEYQQEYQQ